MRCCDCQFNHRGCYWNRCDLLESEFNKYMKYGNGFRVVRFVGNII